VPKIPFSQIPLNQPLQADYFDDRGVLCFGAGQIVRYRHLRIARARAAGGLFVVERPPAVGGETSRRAADPTALPAPAGAAGVGGEPRPDAAAPTAVRFGLADAWDLSNRSSSTTCHAPGLLAGALEDCRREYDAAVTGHARLAAQLLVGRGAALERARDRLAGFQRWIDIDPALSSLVIQLPAGRGETLYRHRVNVAMLTMTVARHLGYPPGEVLEAGMGAMFHDVGMLEVPDSIRTDPGPLSAASRRRVQLHPLRAIEAVKRFEKVSKIALLVVCQMHERMDGSGYPQGRSRDRIHPLARVAAVADVFVAAASWRPYRPARGPYGGIRTMLEDVRAGLLDGAAARAFLDCVGVFPVGSFVRLCDGTVAQVLRSGRAEHTRPTVMPIDERGQPAGDPIDLTHRRDRHVAGVVPSPWPAV